MLRFPKFFHSPGRSVGWILVALSFFMVVSGVGQSTASEKPSQSTKTEQSQTRKEQHILREFRQSLGKGRKVFQALSADLRGKGEIFVVAVTQDSNDYAPKLRIFKKSRKNYKEEFVTLGGEVFDQLFLEDVTKDGYIDVISLWECGQLTCIVIVGYTPNKAFRVLLYQGGRKIELKPASDGTKEVWVTYRTYEEKYGKPWAMATAVYRWDGRAFVEATKRPQR